MATTDKLTGVANRQMFDFLFNQAEQANRRRNMPLSVLILDIDHFKYVNDTYGHQAGDQVLQNLATGLGDVIRGEDILFRWGGEEFLVLSSDCDAQQAAQLGERIRARIETLAVYRGEGTIQVTVSVGAAQFQPGENADALISRADRALYRAKKNGRNRVEMAG